MTVLLLASAAAIPPAAAVATFALLRARTRRRLAAPWLNGIPLPAIDDPRWVAGDSPVWAHFGPCDLRFKGHFRFTVTQSGRVCFEEEEVGYWDAYCNAVLGLLRQGLKEDRASRALKAMDNV